MTYPRSAIALVDTVWRALGEGPLPRAADPRPQKQVPFASRTATSALAWASVTLAMRAAGRASDAAAPDPDRIAVAYGSDRHIRIDGRAPSVWAPLSGFFRVADGWVRTHGNYPHHARALIRGLGLAEDASRDAVTAALGRLPAASITRAIARAGGLCVAVEREQPDIDEQLRAESLLATRRIGDAPARSRGAGTAGKPLRGIRVLDFTRVIAGPVATRTLALLGADVLRIDSPALPEPEWQHLDTGHGKRTTLLDVHRNGAVLEHLLANADVVVTGYRPRAVDELGLSPSALARRHPGLVVARLSAWGFDAEAAERRGFDSLVQAASGIAWLESPDGETPGALPVQALDHSAGYLLASAVAVLLRRQTAEGGTWLAETSLRRIAAELLGMPRATPVPTVDTIDPAPHTTHFEVDGIDLVTARPALPGAEFEPPRPWGKDRPEWLPR